VARTRSPGFSGGEGGFTLPEVMIVIVLMGIVFAIASSTWFGVVESREVDSATNQMVSDLRLAHTSASNRLANWEVVLTSGSSSYQMGPEMGPADALRTRTLPDGTEIYLDSGGTITIVFEPEGSVEPTGSPITFEVRSATDGNPFHEIEVNTQTSRIRVD
jgi:prepilin-type N-terminal cleavage/methylation domain-containing protein